MEIEIKIPSVGESVQEAVLAQWYKKSGDTVQKDEPIFVIETDKVTLEIVAEADGILKVVVPEGETVAIGAVVGTLDTEAAPAKAPEPMLPETAPPEAPAEPEEPVTETAPPEPMPVSAEAPRIPQTLPPSVRRLVAEKNVDVSQITGTGPGNRVTKGDVLLYLETTQKAALTAPDVPQTETSPAPAVQEVEAVSRKPMSPMRQRIAARLLEAKQNTAMLTTFNEIDMSRTMAIRSQFKDAFKEKYGVNLGFMSFFIKAGVEALKAFPEINAYIDGKEIVYHNHQHIGIAIGTGRGLVVPVIRNAERLGFAELEQAVVDYVGKIKNNRLELADLEGGTFTITNGGVFGSLLSTPILNMPQSGILGMHKIEKRPVVVGDEIKIRPMMYVALSYDHRIVDGREAVTFLVRIKECIENPERIMMEI
ncbi:MAG: 2-oxoglutarate dehydrogenase complex dihydrolipoyllysine-residue succinyltransferase [Deltaproteobacteria bacterium]|nr:2-oxoglutarate dehydrogenase complex dihydrolipoyllysine-residue succinyltransferase [Deltaproteobacteria bacterium]